MHLEHAFAELRTRGYPEATIALSELFRAAAVARGVPDVFNATLTSCWVRLVAAALARAPQCRTVDELLTQCPQLADTDLPLAFYEKSTLYGDVARGRDVPPDVQPLPNVDADVRWEAR